ncbi:MAG: hypothetical protein GC161_18405 [Planctomycetaceae bacterium]|nr:hypothetical protein [Planctomycetaceae bacterium]
MEAEPVKESAQTLDAQVAAALPWLRDVKAKGPEFGMQPDGTFVLPLKKPVKKGGEMLDRLKFRPCSGLDLRWFGDASQTQNFGRLLSLAGRMTGEIDTVIDRLDAPDAHRVCEVAAAFFSGATELLGGGS